MKLVEACEGEGRLTVRGEAVGSVAYAIHRFQAMTPGGLPVPGLHRIEGRLAIEMLEMPIELDTQLSLELEDGRSVVLKLVDESGRVLAEGHGPGQCGCC